MLLSLLADLALQRGPESIGTADSDLHIFDRLVSGLATGAGQKQANLLGAGLSFCRSSYSGHIGVIS